MGSFLPPREIVDQRARKWGWILFALLVLVFAGYSSAVFIFAYKARHVPAVNLDYKVEPTTLPDAYLCPHAFASTLLPVPIRSIQVGCQVVVSNETVVGGRARLSEKSGIMHWGPGNELRIPKPSLFTYISGANDCEAEAVGIPYPDFLGPGGAGGSFTCFKFNTSRFTYLPAQIKSGFIGVQLLVQWTVATNSSIVLDDYWGGGNLQIGNVEDPFNGQQVAGNSVQDGVSTVVISLSERTFLNGSKVVTGIFTSTSVPIYNRPSFPPYDDIIIGVALDKRGTLFVRETSPINWTVLATQIVAGWTFVVAVFGFFFNHKVHRYWSLQWACATSEPQAIDSKEALRTPSDLYP